MKGSTAIILIVISVGLYYSFISPQYDAIKLLRAQTDQYQSVLANVSDLKARRDQLKAKYDSIPTDEIDRLDKVLPDHIDSVRLAYDFSTIAARYGISLQSIKTTAEQTANVDTPQLGGVSTGPKGIQKVNVSLSFVATYDNFRKFMKDIEASLRIVDIQSLTFAAAENGLSQYTLTLTTYWLK